MGRNNELQVFKQMVEEIEPSHLLLYVSGTGGQGKSSLLRYYADYCDENSIPYFYLDCRYCESTPTSFISAFEMASPFSQPIYKELASYPGRVVLIIDSYEKVSGLDDWLRMQFLPKLPSNIFTVIAGRNELGISWKSDPSWRDLIKYISLSELNDCESKELLKKRRIPEKFLNSIIESTHGNALALSIVADTFDQKPDEPFYSIDSPDIVKRLLDQFVEDVPDDDHRAALELCSLIYMTTEKIIGLVLGNDKAHRLFNWLTTLTFIEKGPEGIYPHDIVRDVIASELSWRNQRQFQFLLNAARNIYTERIISRTGKEQKDLIYSLTYVHRFHPVIKSFVEFQGSISCWQDTLQEQDIPTLVSAVKKHEGTNASACFKNWVGHPAADIWVFRGASMQVEGFVLRIDISKVKKPTHDEAINKVLDYIKDMDLQEGQLCTVDRFWMGVDTYQAVSHAQSAIYMAMVQSNFTPNLAMSFTCCSNPAAFEQVYSYTGMPWIKELNFTENDTEFGFFFRDWRKENAIEWLKSLNSHGLENMQPAELPDPASPLPVKEGSLSENDFGQAISEALKHIDNPKRMVNSPLLQCHFVKESDPIDNTPISLALSLADVLTRHINQLENTAKHQGYYRLLYRTFINPVGSQQETADFLCMSFSTYRRQLKSAIQWIADMLWIEENKLANRK